MIFFFDEGRFGLQSTIARIWGKRGKPTYIKVKQGYKNFYIYSCICPNTGESFSLFLPEIRTEMMNIFFEEFSKKYPDKEVIIILDQAGWHKSKNLKIPDNIKLIFLPPYSPELNPVERLWKWLRKEVTHNNIFETLKELMNALIKEFCNLTEDILIKLCNCSYL